MTDPKRHSTLPSAERIAEYVEGARDTLTDDLPAGHKLWKSWALDLADNLLALARKNESLVEQLETMQERLDIAVKERSAAVDAANHWHYEAKRLRGAEEIKGRPDAWLEGPGGRRVHEWPRPDSNPASRDEA